jgi:hypothetical protein
MSEAGVMKFNSPSESMEELVNSIDAASESTGVPLFEKRANSISNTCVPVPDNVGFETDHNMVK